MITLATLHEYTAQQIFDYIANHLLTQGEQCQDFDEDTSPVTGLSPVCVYRNSSGQSCAAGCLIGPEEYHPAFETLDWTTLMNDDKVPPVHYDLISYMQKVHDNWNASSWYTALQKTAAVYNFDTTNLDMCAKENNYC